MITWEIYWEKPSRFVWIPEFTFIEKRLHFAFLHYYGYIGKALD